MELQDLTQQLRQELNVFKQTQAYQLNNYPKDMVAATEIAMLLVEFAARNKSKIREEDQFWFNGSYQVSRLFEEHEKIVSLYVELVKHAKTFF